MKKVLSEMNFVLLIIKCICLVHLTEAFVPEFLQRDLHTLLYRLNIKHVTFFEQNSGNLLENAVVDIKAAKLITHVWLNSVNVLELGWRESTVGAIFYPMTFISREEKLIKLIRLSDTKRPLILYAPNTTLLPAWLHKTLIPYTSNVYVILQDSAQHPGELTLQGVYHLHEESAQLTVDLVARRRLHGSSERWTFFGSMDNTLRRSDLQGLEIRTVIPAVMYDTSDHSFGTFHKDTEPFVRLVFHALNASMVPVLLHERSPLGARNASGSWSGMIGLLQRGEAEFSMISVAPSALVHETIDFTCPYAAKEYHLYIRKPEFTYSLSTSFKGFTVHLWLASGVTLCFLSIATTMVSMVERRVCLNRSPSLSLSESMLYTTGSCCLQGWNRWSNLKSGCLIFLCSSLFGFLLNLLYVSQLQAALTAKIVPLPFKDLKGLVETNGEYLPAIFPGTTPYVYALSATNGTMARIRDMMTKDPARILVPDLVAGMQRICADKSALIVWKAAAITRIFLKANCTIVDTKESIFPISVALGVAKRYTYKNVIDFFLRRIAEGGLAAHFSSGGVDDANISAEFTMIELTDVIPFLVLYAGALVLSLAILLAELLVKSLRVLSNS